MKSPSDLVSKRIVGVLALLFLSIFSSADLWAEVLIIAHPSVNVESINMQELKNVFMGNRVKWTDELQIEVVVLKDSSVHKEFTREITHKTSAQFKNWWRRMLFTGKGMFPKEFDSEQALMKYVAENKGAIGYVAPGTKITGVKVIQVLKDQGGMDE